MALRKRLSAVILGALVMAGCENGYGHQYEECFGNRTCHDDLVCVPRPIGRGICDTKKNAELILVELQKRLAK